jgi:hypothetical protein
MSWIDDNDEKERFLGLHDRVVWLTTPTASKANRVVPTKSVYFLGSPTNGLEDMGGRSVNTYHRTIASPANVTMLATCEKGANSFRFLIKLMATNGRSIIIM